MRSNHFLLIPSVVCVIIRHYTYFDESVYIAPYLLVHNLVLFFCIDIDYIFNVKLFTIKQHINRYRTLVIDKLLLII